MLDTNIYKMAEKGLNDPDKDYGLPKVEIKPLSHSSIPLPKPVNLPEKMAVEEGHQTLEPKETASRVEETKEQTNEKAASIKEETQKVIPVTETTKEVALKKAPQVEDEPSRVYPGEKKKTPVKEETKKPSYAWVWIIAILGLGVGAWAIFNSYKGQPEEEPEPVTERVAETPVATPPPPEVEEIEQPVQKIGLTEIREREESPRFFVVVGSFNNETMAKDYSENLHQREMNTFLVYPYGEVKNYRLAVAHFPSFDQALNELNRVKGDFKKEELWVLKY